MRMHRSGSISGNETGYEGFRYTKDGDIKQDVDHDHPPNIPRFIPKG